MSIQNQHPPKNIPIWKWLIAIGIVLAVLVGAVMVASHFAEPKLRDVIEQEANSLLSPHAELIIEDVSISLFPPSVTLSGITLGPPGGGRDARSSTIQTVQISGLGPGTRLSSDDISLPVIEISGADLHIVPKLVSDLIQRTDSNGDDTPFTLERFSILQSNLNLYRPGASSPFTHLKNFHLSISDIDLSPKNDFYRDKIGNAKFSTDSVSYMMESRNYRAEAKHIELDYGADYLGIGSLRLEPQYSPRLLSLKLGHQVDHMVITSGSVQVTGLKMDQWLDYNELNAAAIQMNDLILEVSRDKNFPDKPRTEKPLLNTQFADLKYAMSVDSLIWNGGSITYREMEEGQEKYGAVLFDSLQAVFSGIQNRNMDDVIRGTVSSKLMGVSELNAGFEFYLSDNGLQKINGTLEPFDLGKMNPVFEPLAFISVEDGYLKSLEFNFSADKQKAEGVLLVFYDNLSIKMLDKETLGETTSKDVVSFFANLIGVRSSNEMDDPREGDIDFEREKERSMFSYWWKSLRSGLTNTAMRL